MKYKKRKFAGAKLRRADEDRKAALTFEAVRLCLPSVSLVSQLSLASLSPRPFDICV